MKTNVFLLGSILILSTVLLARCSSPSDKVKDAAEDVVAAEEKLAQEEVNYKKELADYVAMHEQQIAINDKSIADFNARMESKKVSAKSNYESRIKELNQQNSDMKLRLEQFKDNSKSNWSEFKADFSDDMKELGDSIRNFTTNSQ